MLTEVFHTVPFYGVEKMLRDAEGRKVDQAGNPIKPTTEWLKYTKKRNKQRTPILGAIALNDFIGIDIDTQPLFQDALKAISKQPAYVAASVPTEKGGHILFSYKKTPELTLKTLLKLAKPLKKLKIDIQTGNKLIYLATQANATKRLLTPPIMKLSELTPLPDSLVTYFTNLILENPDNPLHTQKQTHQEDYLATNYGYMLSQPFTPLLVSHLTPKRDFPNIKQMDEIPKGSATEWMLQVRKKLQVDPTVSPEKFSEVIHYLSSLWTQPRNPQKRLQYDIERDINAPQFKYNPHWAKEFFTFPNHLQQTIHVFYAPETSTTLLHNTSTDDIYTYQTISHATNAILTLHAQKKRYKVSEVLTKAKPVEIVDTPLYPPRLSVKPSNTPSLELFNLYTPSEGTHILTTKQMPKDYKRPDTILDFLKHLFPDKNNRKKLLQFLAYKHQTYEHSPLYFVLMGVGGAGKGLFKDVILSYFSGSDRIASETLHGLLNNFNDHLEALDYLSLEEAGEGYTKREQAQLVAQLKRITGNEHLTIEGKGVRKRKIRHFITPFIDTNLETKLITSTSSDDRRLVLLKCPNKLIDYIRSPEYPFKDISTTTQLVEAMRAELPSFAYYLATLPTIEYSDYIDNTSWKTEDYSEYLASTLSYSDRLLDASEHYNIRDFVDALVDAGVDDTLIDKLFEPSTTTRGRVVLYSTRATQAEGILSLQDLCEQTPTLEADTKKRFKRVAVYRTLSYTSKNIRVKVLDFTHPYQPRVPAPTVPEDEVIKL